ncbi:MAG: DUF6076 domain-containing protein [Ruminococcus sp.]|jgi:hypothetical protein|nr:DUF6076 domain-containing protein [Ruminococcus sp.]
MVKPSNLYFTDRTNSGNAFFKLEVGRSLLQFSEFDFTFFWETAIEAGRQAKRTGTLPKATMDSARAAISKAHPFIYAGRDGDFSDIVLDCIIEYICRSERLSEDELWMRCISSRIPYEAALFERISKYKTFRGANEWTIVSGLQKYVKDKINFIYEGEQQTSLKCLTLKQYFDLAYSIASNECAIPGNALPSIKVYNPCLAPSAAFAVSSSAAKSIYKRLEEQLYTVPDLSDNDRVNTELLEDKFAVTAYSYMMGMSRPQEPEEELFVKNLENLPEKVYVVSSLKALIDLEFDIMSETGVHLKKCENCGRYFLITATEFGEKYCDRINSSGLTCKALAARMPKLTMPPEPEPVAPPPPPEPEPVYVPPTVEYEPDELDEPENVPFVTNSPPPKTFAEPVREYYTPKIAVGAEIPDNIEKHCIALYNSIYKRADKGISENDFRDWSSYLSNMKRNVKTGEGTLDQLLVFLAYSDKLADDIKRAARQKRFIPREPIERLRDFARATDNMHSIGNVKFPEYSITPPPPPATPTDKDYSNYFAEDRTPAFKTYTPPPPPVIRNIPEEAVQQFAPASFGEPPQKSFGNVKIKDSEPVEIDGRKATLANPVWERVKREE